MLFSMLTPWKTSAKTKSKLNKTSITMYTGTKVKLKLKGTKRKCKWSVNKPQIISVSQKGIVKAKKKGKAKVIAKIKKKKYICKVTVKAKKKQTDKSNSGNKSTPDTSANTNTNTNDSASGNLTFMDNSKVYLGRNLALSSGDLNIGENVIVVVNMPSEWENDSETGVVNISDKYTLIMKTGSVLVTLGDKYHRINAMRYDCASGSLIVTDMVKSLYDKKKEYTSKFGNVICKKMDVRTTEFNENAHVFVSDEIHVQDSKQITFNPGTKLLLGKNSENESISNCGQINFNRSPANKVFAIGAIGTVTGLQSGNGNYTLYNGSFLSAPGLSINNLTIDNRMFHNPNFRMSN